MLLNFHLIQLLSLQVNPQTIEHVLTEIPIKPLCIPLRLQAINIWMDELGQPPILPLFDETKLGERINDPKRINVPAIPTLKRVLIIFLTH